MGFLTKRVALAIPVLFLVSAATFALVRIAPSDPVTSIVGVNASPEQRQRVAEELRLSEPIVVQYWAYLGDLLEGDFGRSYTQRLNVGPLIAERMWNTLKLAGLALILSYLIGIPVGVYAAYKRGSWIDHGLLASVYVGQATPAFVLGLFLILIFGYWLGWLPTSGAATAEHLILPVAALTVGNITVTARVIRTSMIDTIKQDYIRTASSKGLSTSVIIWKHAFRNGLLPSISLLALRLAFLFEGAVAVEVLFGWPGAGKLLVDAAVTRDFPVIQGMTFALAGVVVASSLLADVLHSVADPRLRQV